MSEDIPCPNCHHAKLKEVFNEPPVGTNTGVVALQCLTGDYESYHNVSSSGEQTTIYEVFVFPDVRVRLGKLYTVFGEENYGMTYQFRMKVEDVRRIGSNWKSLRNLL
jgi:hypothetical protein